MRQGGVISVLVAFLAACGSVHGQGPSVDGGAGDGSQGDGRDGGAGLGPPGSTWHTATYEAEDGKLGGGAAVVGAPDTSSRSVGDLAGEASRRQAVVLGAPDDSIAWPVRAAEIGANAIAVRFSLPDAGGGGGAEGSLDLQIQAEGGATRYERMLRLTSRYAWVYGGAMDGTKLYNVPANAKMYGTADTPTHLYDEIQLMLGASLQAGDVVRLALPSGQAAPVTVDLLDLETVPAPLAMPKNFLSFTDPSCGGIPLDTRHTGQAFDGADDASYGSVFHAVDGTNPYRPPGSVVHEKDYYTTDPAKDVLLDTTPTPAAGGLSMFGLADHNFQSLVACANRVVASGGVYAGLYVPKGRYYVRGSFHVPSGLTMLGAGMWHTKFVAVDTAPPTAVDVNGVQGIAGVSGNLVFGNPQAIADHVTLSNFSIFGNVTQRDGVDDVVPFAVHGQFTSSVFDNLWVEHENIGLNANGASNHVQFTRDRVRDTFADGLDFYGSTSNSSMTNCESRGTGDDGFALWSQGATLATLSTGNSISNSVSRLCWFGHGMSIYGGVGSSIRDSAVYDVLNFAGLDVSTEFVPPALPASAKMTADVSGITLVRSGGDGFHGGFGALLVGADAEAVDGVSIKNVTIDVASYSAIDLRLTGAAPVPGTVLRNVTLQDIEVTEISPLGKLGTPCAVVKGNLAGNATLTDVCVCPRNGGSPSICPVTNMTTSFQTSGGGCTMATCRPAPP